MFFFRDTDTVAYDMIGQFDLICADTGYVSQAYRTFAPVLITAAAWLFGFGLIGLIGLARRKYWSILYEPGHGSSGY
jgi:hypothetical protein